MPRPTWFYQTRSERVRWLLERFNEHFSEAEAVLDVGCDTAELKTLLPSHVRYVGVDMGGNPDIRINLDTMEQLPFQDGEFDVVVCADVLEHLERIHFVFDELCRVSKRAVIVTLPNPLPGVVHYLKRARTFPKGKGSRMKFYGLPLEPPKDRHRWFYSADEARAFVRYRSKKNGFRLTTDESDQQYRSDMHTLLRRLSPLSWWRPGMLIFECTKR